MNKRRQRRRRIQLIKRYAIVAAALFVVVVGVVVLLNTLKRDDKTTSQLFLPYRAKAAEVEEPKALTAGELPSLFADKLCISKESETLDKNITSLSAAVYNRTTGEVIYSEEADTHRAQASITKLLTFYIALEYGKLDDVVTVRGEWLENLDPDSSVCDIKDGDEITLEQLLYGLMMPSGNDAANAIAYYISGSESAFVDLMNETSKRLGMTNSHFMNAHGLDDPNHYSCVYDIYLVFNRLLDYEFFRQVIGTQNYTANFTNNGEKRTESWSRGIWYFNGNRKMPAGLTGIGGKTGTTPGAQYCLSYSFSDEAGNEYIAITLYSGKRERMYNVMDVLLSKVAK